VDARTRNRIEMAVGEMLGIRPRVHDNELLYETAVRRANSDLRDVRSATSVAQSNYSVESGRIADAIAANQRARAIRGDKLLLLTDEFGKMGIDTGRLISLAREAGVSKEAVKAAMSGYAAAYKPTVDDLRTIYNRRQEIDGTGAKSLREIKQELDKTGPVLKLEK
jgi:hypothetical protein